MLLSLQSFFLKFGVYKAREILRNSDACSIYRGFTEQLLFTSAGSMLLSDLSQIRRQSHRPGFLSVQKAQDNPEAPEAPSRVDSPRFLLNSEASRIRTRNHSKSASKHSNEKSVTLTGMLQIEFMNCKRLVSRSDIMRGMGMLMSTVDGQRSKLPQLAVSGDSHTVIFHLQSAPVKQQHAARGLSPGRAMSHLTSYRLVSRTKSKCAEFRQKRDWNSRARKAEQPRARQTLGT